MESLEAGFHYHIYNRGNNKQYIFFEEENYYYFLRLIEKYLCTISELYAYCLLPNHYHLLLRINDACQKPSQAFSNLMNAYTKAINKRFNRTGSLFQKPFKRIRVDSENSLINLILYIQNNPQNHNLVDRFEAYKFSSYKKLIHQDAASILNSEHSVAYFDNIENFKNTHNIKEAKFENESMTLED